MRLSDLEEKGFPSIDKQLKNFKSKLDKTGQKPADIMKDPRASMAKPGAGTGPSMQIKMNGVHLFTLLQHIRVIMEKKLETNR